MAETSGTEVVPCLGLKTALAIVKAMKAATRPKTITIDQSLNFILSP
jgi:hypothetical protein